MQDEFTLTLFACWFQPGLFNQPTVFFSKKTSTSQSKPVPAPTNEQGEYWNTFSKFEYY